MKKSARRFTRRMMAVRGGDRRPLGFHLVALSVLTICGLVFLFVLARQWRSAAPLSLQQVEQRAIQYVQGSSTGVLTQVGVQRSSLWQALGLPLASCSPLENAINEARVGLTLDASNPCDLNQPVWVVEMLICTSGDCKRVQLIYTESGQLIREARLPWP